MGRFIKIAIAGLALLGILTVFSSAGIRSMEAWARDKPDTSMGISMPYRLGGLAYYTFRYELARDIYETNLDTMPDNPRIVHADFRVAMCLEKLGRFDEAVARYDNFAIQ